MGIDVHALNFLRYANKNGKFRETVTLARPGFHVVKSYTKDPFIRKIIKSLVESKNERYCEELLRKYFGSKNVDSVDNSNYEGATIVQDMNLPIPSNIRSSYDTVIDAGTLEHIYNIPQAFVNCSALCKPGGQILHMLPANNFCGHGFWQFSPELFFSLYSQENGYSGTEVFLADAANLNTWYKVKAPRNGQRVNVHTSNRLYVLVRSIVDREDSSFEGVQQSDYVFKWTGQDDKGSLGNDWSIQSEIKQKIGRSRTFRSLILPIYRSFFRLRPAPTMKLNSWNPGLTKCNVVSLLKPE